MSKGTELLETSPGSESSGPSDRVPPLHGDQPQNGFSNTKPLLTAVFETASEYIWAVDAAEFALITFNGALAEYFRTERNFVLKPGARPEDLFPPGEMVSRWKEMYRRALDDGECEVDYPVYAGTRTLHLRLWPVVSECGSRAIAGFGWDVTAQRRMESNLGRSEARLRTFLERMPAAVGATRGTTSLYINQAYRRLFGLSEQPDYRGRSILDHLAPEVHEAVREFACRRKDGQPAPEEYDTVGLRGDRTTFPMHVAVRVLDFEDGPATIGIFTDLTVRKAAERELASREAFFREVLRNSPDAAYVFDADRKFRFVSSTAESMLQYAENQLIDLAHDVHPEDQNKVDEAIRSLLDGEKAEVRIVWRAPAKDGSVRWVESVGRNAIDNPDVQGIVVNTRDITQQRRLEEELRQAHKLETVGRLASHSAHLGADFG